MTPLKFESKFLAFENDSCEIIELFYSAYGFSILKFGVSFLFSEFGVFFDTICSSTRNDSLSSSTRDKLNNPYLFSLRLVMLSSYSSVWLLKLLITSEPSIWSITGRAGCGTTVLISWKSSDIIRTVCFSVSMLSVCDCSMISHRAAGFYMDISESFCFIKSLNSTTFW